MSMSVAMMSAVDWVCLFCAAMAVVVSRATTSWRGRCRLVRHGDGGGGRRVWSVSMSVAMMSAVDWVCLFCAAMAIVVSRATTWASGPNPRRAATLSTGWRMVPP